MAKKTAAQLDREIAAVVTKPLTKRQMIARILDRNQYLDLTGGLGPNPQAQRRAYLQSLSIEDIRAEYKHGTRGL